MVIGCMGKGGSGKTTLATLLTKYAVSQGFSTLAIDADHNMDLSYNLGAPEDMPFVGISLKKALAYLGLSEKENYRAALFVDSYEPFRLKKATDSYTEEFSLALSPTLRLMTCGPHTEKILNDESCSHSLFTPLKVYLPLLEEDEEIRVIVDEKAGTDAAGTGVATGFDFTFITCEPTPHSKKAVMQIASILEHFDAPYAVVGTKIKNADDEAFVRDAFPTHLAMCIPFDARVASFEEEAVKQYGEILMKYAEKNRSVTSRKTRSKRKFKDYAPVLTTPP